jgi:hypothetical protein
MIWFLVTRQPEKSSMAEGFVKIDAVLSSLAGIAEMANFETEFGHFYPDCVPLLVLPLQGGGQEGDGWFAP